MDPFAVEVGNGEVATVVFAVGGVLGDALVRPSRVVMRLVFGQDGAQVGLPEDQHAIQELTAQGADERSQIAFMRGAWTAVRTILVPVAWKTASKDAVKFDPRSRIRNLTSSNRCEADGKVAGLLHGPIAGGVRGDAAKMHRAGVMFDEYQDIQSPEEHGGHVQEIDCDDPGGLGMQELPPALARAAPDRCPQRAGSPAQWRARLSRRAS